MQAKIHSYTIRVPGPKQPQNSERGKPQEIPHPHFPSLRLASTHPPPPPVPFPGGVMMMDRPIMTLEPPALSLGDLAWGAGDLLRRGLGWVPPFRPGYESRPDERPLSFTPHTPPLSLSRIGALPTVPIALRQIMGGDEEPESAVHSEVSSPSRTAETKAGGADERLPEQA